jgi:glucose-6-phosphate isomerase
VRVITISPSCDPPRRGSQSRQGETRELVTNLVAHRWRCDPLLLEPSDPDGNVPVEGPGQTLPELMAAGIRATKEHQRSVGRPGADLHLPKINEYVVGQVLQMLMLATAVEERLQEIHSDDFLKSRRSTV